MTTFSGGCLCGSVTYTGSDPQSGGYCYCNDCRRSSGTGHCSHMIVAEASFSSAGEVRFYDSPADSGNRVSRGFCPICGSPVYSRNSGMPGMVFVRASSLNETEVFEPMMTVYTSRAPHWDQPSDSVPGFPEMPPPSDMPDLEA